MHWNNELKDYVPDWRDRSLSIRDSFKIQELKKLRKEACGIGTRKMKIRLGKLAKTDPLARAYYDAFEAEEASILAKKYSFQRSQDYTDKYYDQKSDLIWRLVAICKEHNYKFGIKYSPEFEESYIRYIIYFDLPGCAQISWHTPDVPDGCPVYDGEWDEAEVTTLKKLENAIGVLLTNS